MASSQKDDLEPMADGANASSASDSHADQPGQDPDGSEAPTLADDLANLIDDGFNFFDAELAYQKTRASFVADRIKKAFALGAFAVVLALLAVFALVFGLILALSTLITPWGATALVVGVLLLLAYWFVRRASAAMRSMQEAVKSQAQEELEDNG